VIIGGDWLVTSAGEPIRGGAIVSQGSRVHAVGTYAELTAADPSLPAEYFRDCVLTPGLVNAHTHLALTVLKDLAPPAPLPQWLRGVTRAILRLSDDDIAASTSLGALECLMCGVTVVGDIAYGPEALAAAADAGLGGVFYWEVLGLDAGDLSGELAEREFPTESGACTAGRTRCGISPHTPYTSGPRLLRAAHAVAVKHGVSFAVHVAESAAERELLASGAGPFADTARRLAPDFKPPRKSPVAYLESLGVLDAAVAVHCVDVDAADIALLKRRARGVVLCPRSNAYLHNGEPPVTALYRTGISLGVGTDSAASNADLDLLAEAREVRRIGRTVTSRRLMRMLTCDGAKALGVDDEFGSLEPGKQADVAIFRTGPTPDPETAVLLHGGRDVLEALLAAGVWRVREGRPCFPVGTVERAAERARETARRAIEEG
jgi:cytosine/adenosine deaminase-related metal-dependent hydrolase